MGLCVPRRCCHYWWHRGLHCRGKAGGVRMMWGEKRDQKKRMEGGQNQSKICTKGRKKCVQRRYGKGKNELACFLCMREEVQRSSQVVRGQHDAKYSLKAPKEYLKQKRQHFWFLSTCRSCFCMICVCGRGQAKSCSIWALEARTI